MSNDFPGDLYGRLIDEDLGKGYYETTVNLVEMLLINDWLITRSCFFVIIPLPMDEYLIIVKSETEAALGRKLQEVRDLFERMKE